MYYLHACLVHPKRNPNGMYGGYKAPALIRITRDTSDLDKNAKLEIIKNPPYTFYVTKEPIDEFFGFIDMDKVEKKVCGWTDRHRAMATAVGLKEEFKNFNEKIKDGSGEDRYQSKRKWVSENLINNPNIFHADNKILSWDKTNYFLERDVDEIPQVRPRMSYMDIESRTPSNADKEALNHGHWTIYLITHYNEWTNTMYSFALADEISKNSISKHLGGYTEDHFRKYLEAVRNMADMEAAKNYYFEPKVFDNERDLLISYWDMIHETKPEFCGIWNMNYDINTIFNRMKKLGMDIDKICPHPDIPNEYKRCTYKSDINRVVTTNPTNTSLWSPNNQGGDSKKSYNDKPAMLWDNVYIPGYTRFYDAMALYANIRKLDYIPSYNLEKTAERELNLHKLPLNKMGYTIHNVEQKDYGVTLRYGIVDTALVHRLEESLMDVATALQMCEVTPFEKVTAGSNILFDVTNFLLHKEGFVPHNIISYNDIQLVYPDAQGEFRGGLVAQTKFMVCPPSSIDSIPTNLYKWTADEDYSTMYPVVIITTNISKDTLVGRLYGLPQRELDRLNDVLLVPESGIFRLGEYIGTPDVETVLKDINMHILT